MTHPENIIGFLAIFTLVALLGGALFHYRSYLKDPLNRAHAKNVSADGKGATTKVGEDAEAGSLLAKPLKTRLDASIASQHPADPSLSATRAERTDQFNIQRIG